MAICHAGERAAKYAYGLRPMKQPGQSAGRFDAQFEGRPVWAEVSLGAIAHNLRLIRSTIGQKRKILAIVKANAYGLGAVDISKALARMGVEAFGVTCSQEGVELREAGIR